MKISDAILVIKEFFLDIIGYLIPGVVVLLLAALYLEPDYRTNLENLSNLKHSIYIILIISYVIGHIIHGSTRIKDKILAVMNKGLKWITCKKLSFTEKDDVIESIKNHHEFVLGSQLIKKRLENEKYFENTQLLQDENLWTNVKALRNLAMSFVPEADSKIYKFRFRADLCSNVNTAFIVFALIGLVDMVFHLFEKDFIFQSNKYYFYSYIILVILAYFLHKSRIYFYRISYLNNISHLCRKVSTTTRKQFSRQQER